MHRVYPLLAFAAMERARSIGFQHVNFTGETGSCNVKSAASGF